MQQFWQDLRYGMRLLIKNPGFTFVAVITLSLGIGGNIAIFSLINAVMLRPLPVQHPERLIQITRISTGGKPQSISYPVWKKP